MRDHRSLQQLDLRHNSDELSCILRRIPRTVSQVHLFFPVSSVLVSRYLNGQGSKLLLNLLELDIHSQSQALSRAPKPCIELSTAVFPDACTMLRLLAASRLPLKASSTNAAHVLAVGLLPTLICCTSASGSAERQLLADHVLQRTLLGDLALRQPLVGTASKPQEGSALVIRECVPAGAAGWHAGAGHHRPCQGEPTSGPGTAAGPAAATAGAGLVAGWGRALQ